MQQVPWPEAHPRMRFHGSGSRRCNAAQGVGVEPQTGPTTPGHQCRDRPPRRSDPPAHAPCFGHTGAAATAHGAQIGHICTLKLVITGNAAAAPNGGYL